MKSQTLLQCDQCENDNGAFVSSELDITDCRKIENIRGRLVCTSRETPRPTADDATDGNKDDNDDGTPGDNVKDPQDADQTKTPDDIDDVDENPEDGLPAGSYRKDCTGCELKYNGQLLACDFCKRNDDVYQYTVAYVSGCKYFLNIDGVLRCKKGYSTNV